MQKNKIYERCVVVVHCLQKGVCVCVTLIFNFYITTRTMCLKYSYFGCHKISSREVYKLLICVL